MVDTQKATQEKSLREKDSRVRAVETEKWFAANRKAIDAYNARVECDGIWSDKLRGF